jgi:hypothetical protein
MLEIQLKHFHDHLSQSQTVFWLYLVGLRVLLLNDLEQWLVGNVEAFQ